MSNTALTQTREAADQVLGAVVDAQDAVVNAVTSFVKVLPAGANVPTVPAVPADVPTAQEISSTFFEYAERVVANQRAFADRILAAV